MDIQYTRNKQSEGPRTKFKDPSCPFFPPVIPVWKQALINVDISTETFSFEELASDSGYVVPEPASLVFRKVTAKTGVMFRSWLMIRELCLARLSAPQYRVRPMFGKVWTMILTAKLAIETARDSIKAAEKRKELADTLKLMMGNTVGQDTGTGFVADMMINIERASWHGIAYDALNDNHLEQILWELHEINFRFEFQALDRRARVNTPFETLPDGDIALMGCFPEMSFAVPGVHTANHGIASLSNRERAHYLFAMAMVMSKWKSVNQNGLIVKMSKLHWSPEEIDELEAEVASLYTQSFYNSFRRPPVIPHRLSEAAKKSIPGFKTHHPFLAPIIVNNPSIIINTARKA